MTIEQQFNEMISKGRMPIFEIQVLDNNLETDFIIFNIEVYQGTLRAEHVSLTNEEQQSDKIAFKAVEIEETMSLDQHLEYLYDKCITSICTSDFYQLAN